MNERETSTGTRSAQRRVREAGITLIEITISLVLLGAVVSAYGATLSAGMKQRQESTMQYAALSRMRTIMARVQDVANQVEDVELGVGIGALYSTYDGLTLTADTGDRQALPNERVVFEVFGDETTIPAAFGGPRDLNFDGDADDNPGSDSNGVDLRIVPMRVELSYEVDGEIRTLEQFRIFTKTNN